MNKKKTIITHLIGWILFLMCAVFFILSSIQNGDTLALIASIMFFIACFVFMIPLIIDLQILIKHHDA